MHFSTFTLFSPLFFGKVLGPWWCKNNSPKKCRTLVNINLYEVRQNEEFSVNDLKFFRFSGNPCAAWKALAITWSIILALGVPRALFFKVNQIFVCASDPPILVKVTTFVGLMAVLITSVLSVVFIIGLKLRKGGTKRSDTVVRKLPLLN